MTLTRPWWGLAQAMPMSCCSAPPLQHSGVCAPGYLLIPHLFKKWECGAGVFSLCKSTQLLRSHSCCLKLFLLPAPIPCLWQDWLNWNTKTEEHLCLREMRAGAGAAMQKCTSRVNHSQVPSLAHWAHPGGEFLAWVGSAGLSCSHS